MESNQPEQTTTHTGFEDREAHQSPFCSHINFVELPNHIDYYNMNFIIVNKNLQFFTQEFNVLLICYQKLCARPQRTGAETQNVNKLNSVKRPVC